MERKESDSVLNWNLKNVKKDIVGRSMSRFFFTDWEGPWVLTDFAYELSFLLFNNSRFFENLSWYDDYKSYVEKEKGYESGYTLRLLIPFLLASNISNDKVYELSLHLTRFVKDARNSMEILLRRWVPVVISTTYYQFLETSAGILGLNKKHLYGTKFDFDRDIDLNLRERLFGAVDIISSLEGAELVSYLDSLFSDKKILEITSEVEIIGAGEKARILEEYCENYNIPRPIVIGDSVSDYKMFEKARRIGGIAIAFNGNEYALKHADVAIVSDSALAEAFVIERLMEGCEVQDLRNMNVREFNCEIYIIEECDINEVIRKSKKMRVKLRGAAGQLG